VTTSIGQNLYSFGRGTGVKNFLNTWGVLTSSQVDQSSIFDGYRGPTVTVVEPTTINVNAVYSSVGSKGPSRSSAPTSTAMTIINPTTTVTNPTTTTNFPTASRTTNVVSSISTPTATEVPSNLPTTTQTNIPTRTTTSLVTETTTAVPVLTNTQVPTETQTQTELFTQTQTSTRVTTSTNVNVFTTPNAPLLYWPKGGLLGGKRRVPSKKVKVKSKYTPSLTSLAFNVRGSKPSDKSISTGLFNRPLPKKKKKVKTLFSDKVLFG